MGCHHSAVFHPHLDSSAAPIAESRSMSIIANASLWWTASLPKKLSFARSGRPPIATGKVIRRASTNCPLLGSFAAHDSGHPPGDSPAVRLVGGAELPFQRWLFVADDEKVEQHPDKAGIGEEGERFEEDRLSEQDEPDGQVHGVASPLVEP